MMDLPLWTLFQNKVDKKVGHGKIIREDSDAIMHQEVSENDKDSIMPVGQISDYGANNLLLPPLTEPLQHLHQLDSVSRLMRLQRHQRQAMLSILSQVTHLRIFDRSSLIHTDLFITFNSKKWVEPVPMRLQHRTVKHIYGICGSLNQCEQTLRK
jgi:hypothetical protein